MSPVPAHGERRSRAKNVERNLSRFRHWAKSLVRAIAGVSPKTEVTIETDQLWVIRRRRGVRAWCQVCGREVDMVRLSEVRGVTKQSQLEIADGSVSEAWHMSEGADGKPLVCLESLLKSL